MKKILVPTDFSDCALYAADAAISIARKTSAEVHFYTRVHVHPLWDQLSEKEKMDFPESFARIQETRKQFQELRERYRGVPVRIVTSYSHGDLIDVVSRYIESEDIYLIVMGSSGADGMKEYLFGSNAQKIVRHAQRPVMVVKHPLVKDEFKNIIFASDFSEEANIPFQQLIQFGRHFGSHIHLVSIATSPSFGETREVRKKMEAFEEQCWALPCFIHEVGDYNIEMGISSLANKLNADLVTVAHFGKSLVKRIFTGSLTESLVNHLEIPILTLNYPELEPWHMLHVKKEEKIA
ncbi:MAG: universal stress protein [Bacteroidia bacterium]|nr:universal stress protein [Bacteroidia bacterium]